MELVAQLEQRFLPRLNQIAEKLSKEFPAVKTNVFSSSVGSLTQYQGHDLGVECLFPDAAPDVDDNVALIIGFEHLTTEPLVNSVDVCWGQGTIESSVFPGPVYMTEDVLEQIEEELPNLYEVLRTAVKRGHPPEES